MRVPEELSCYCGPGGIGIYMNVSVCVYICIFLYKGIYIHLKNYMVKTQWFCSADSTLVFIYPNRESCRVSQQHPIWYYILSCRSRGARIFFRGEWKTIWCFYIKHPLELCKFHKWKFCVLKKWKKGVFSKFLFWNRFSLQCSFHHTK